MSNLISFSDQKTHLGDEEKAVDIALDFSNTFDTNSPSILQEKLVAPGLDSSTFHWLKTGWMAEPREGMVTSSWGRAQVSFPRAQHWGQLCVISLSLMQTRWSPQSVWR